MAHQVDQPIWITTRFEGAWFVGRDLGFGQKNSKDAFSQGSNGRDHNPYGFSIWMAGGGIKGGTVYGSTDDFDIPLPKTNVISMTYGQLYFISWIGS